LFQKDGKLKEALLKRHDFQPSELKKFITEDDIKVLDDARIVNEKHEAQQDFSYKMEFTFVFINNLNKILNASLSSTANQVLNKLKILPKLEIEDSYIIKTLSNNMTTILSQYITKGDYKTIYKAVMDAPKVEKKEEKEEKNKTIAGKESCEDPNNKKDRGDDNDDDNDNDEKGNNGGNAKEKGVQPTTDDPTYKYTDEKGEKVYKMEEAMDAEMVELVISANNVAMNNGSEGEEDNIGVLFTTGSDTGYAFMIGKMRLIKKETKSYSMMEMIIAAYMIFCKRGVC
jgi:hypothetical protein